MNIYEVIQDKHDKDIYHFYLDTHVNRANRVWHCFSVHTDVLDKEIKDIVERDGSADVFFELSFES